MRAATPKNSGRSQKSLDSKAKNHLSNEWISLSTTNQVYNNYNVKLHPNILPKTHVLYQTPTFVYFYFVRCQIRYLMFKQALIGHTL